MCSTVGKRSQKAAAPLVLEASPLEARREGDRGESARSVPGRQRRHVATARRGRCVRHKRTFASTGRGGAHRSICSSPGVTSMPGVTGTPQGSHSGPGGGHGHCSGAWAAACRKARHVCSSNSSLGGRHRERAAASAEDPSEGLDGSATHDGTQRRPRPLNGSRTMKCSLCVAACDGAPRPQGVAPTVAGRDRQRLEGSGHRQKTTSFGSISAHSLMF